MTLKEKFLPFVDDIDLINDIPNKEWGLRNATKCVEIADEFAIGFAYWVWGNCFNIFNDRFNYKDDEYSLKELLEIYKKHYENI